MTGPATAGFEPLASMKKATLQTKLAVTKTNKNTTLELEVKIHHR